MFRGDFIAINAYVLKKESFQVNNLNFHLKTLEKDQTKPEVSQRKEIV